MLAEEFKGNADVLMVSETNLDDTFPVDQFTLEGFAYPSELFATQKAVASYSSFVKV